MKPIILPKKYLSWSQMTLWKSSPERYKKEYFQNQKRLDTRFLRFGKLVANSIETGSIDEALPGLPVYSETEFQINTDVQGVPILCYLDSYDMQRNIFRENKTGLKKNAWTPAKVFKHGQLVYYAVALRSLVGKMPEYCHLDWLITVDEERPPSPFDKGVKDIKLTGEFKSFKREFTEQELDAMEADIRKTAEEITEAYLEFLSEI